MQKLAIAAVVLTAITAPAAAQERFAITVPAATDVMVSLVAPISSKDARVGQRFDVVVARDVMVGSTVAIPRGTRGWGEVAWRTGRGAYGKSGKVEIALRALDVDGQAVPLLGRLREEGNGNTAATIGVALLAGLLPAALVTGHSAVIAEGRELHATTRELATLVGAAPVTVASVAPASVAMSAILAAPAPVTVAPAPKLVAATAVKPAPAAPVHRAVASSTTPVTVAFAQPRPPVIAAVAASVPVAVRYTEARTDYERALAAQRGVHGREPTQGWSIGD